MSGLEDRRAAVRAQLAALSEHDLRLFAEILASDLEAVELPLAEFLADLARQREQGTAELDPAGRAGLHSELARLTAAREAWDETARVCVCRPDLCLRGDFRDHTGEADPSGCMVCADLDPDQACYAAVIRALRERGGAGVSDREEITLDSDGLRQLDDYLSQAFPEPGQ